MEIGINWHAYGNGEITVIEEAEVIRKHGFTHFFLGSEDSDIDNIMIAAGKNALVCDNCHAPFDDINSVWLEGNGGEQMLARLMKSVDICHRYYVPVLVVHLSSGDKCPRITDLGYERFERLVNYGKENSVKIAFENQRKLANIAMAMEEFPDAGFCWDTGHEKCFAHGREYMPLFGDRICAVHIHDNYMIHQGDMHMIPYDASIDFERVAYWLATVNYSGTIMLEQNRHKSGKYENMTPDEYYERAAKAAMHLGSRVEELKRI